MRTPMQLRLAGEAVLNSTRAFAAAVGLPNNVEGPVFRDMAEAAADAMRETMIGYGMEVSEVVMPWNEPVVQATPSSKPVTPVQPFNTPPSTDPHPRPLQDNVDLTSPKSPIALTSRHADAQHAPAPETQQQPANQQNQDVDETQVGAPEVEESTVEEPAVEESAVEESAVEESAVEESAVEESAVEEPTLGPTLGEPTVDESAVDNGLDSHAISPEDFELDSVSENFILMFKYYHPTTMTPGSPDALQYLQDHQSNLEEFVWQRDYALYMLSRNPDAEDSQNQLAEAITEIDNIEDIMLQNKLAWAEHKRLAREDEIRTLVDETEIFCPADLESAEAVFTYETQANQELAEIYSMQLKCQEICRALSRNRHFLAIHGAAPDPLLEARYRDARAIYLDARRRRVSFLKRNRAHRQAKQQQITDQQPLVTGDVPVPRPASPSTSRRPERSSPREGTPDVVFIGMLRGSPERAANTSATPLKQGDAIGQELNDIAPHQEPEDAIIQGLDDLAPPQEQEDAIVQDLDDIAPPHESEDAVVQELDDIAPPHESEDAVVQELDDIVPPQQREGATVQKSNDNASLQGHIAVINLEEDDEEDILVEHQEVVANQDPDGGVALTEHANESAGQEEVIPASAPAKVTFADTLAVEYWASDIFQLLQERPLKQREKSLDGQLMALTQLLKVKPLKPLFDYALQKHFSEELSQAEAAKRNGRSRQVELETQPLEHYCKQPDGLKQNENDIDACMRVFVNLRQDLKDLTLKKLGADSWVWPVIEKFTKHLSKGSPEMIRTEELLLSAAGIEFKKSYGAMSFTKADAESLGIQFDPERLGSIGKKDVKSHARNRAKSYFRNLAHLREKGQFWLVMCGLPSLYSLLGDITDVEVLEPWIQKFGSYPTLLSSRAWSRVNGDYTGTAELAHLAQVPETDKQDWNDFGCNWKTYQDQIEFNNSQQTPFPGILFDPIMLLKHGYLAHHDLNKSWSITLETNGADALYPCSLVPILANSFIGFLPGNCIYRPETPLEELGDVFPSDMPGLFIDEEGCKGILSYMRRVSSFEEGNVIAGWEQHNDMTMPNSNGFHLVLFAYREIASFEEIILWEHLKRN
ncbi:hypothetical protein QM012_006232 [Aureobasidium pullulans]|uniref:Knr4/Smi1-like domain-containing protein n=1 Tax=Aureobasidium pullulans TaxID=5580 RepID=A0ABR0TSL8_AURPU